MYIVATKVVVAGEAVGAVKAPVAKVGTAKALVDDDDDVDVNDDVVIDVVVCYC